MSSAQFDSTGWEQSSPVHPGLQRQDHPLSEKRELTTKEDEEDDCDGEEGSDVDDDGDDSDK